MTTTIAELRRQLAEADCERAAELCRALVDAGASLDQQELGRVRRCIDEDRDGARKRVLTRCYLALLGADRAGDQAGELLHHDSSHVREATFEALVGYGERALPVLEELSRDEHRETRWYAYEAASRAESERAVPMLLAGLKDADFSIRWVASNGLILIGTPAVMQVMTALADDKATPDFHAAVRRVLSRVSAAPPLDAELERLVESLSRETSIYQSPVLARDILHRLYGRQ